MFKNRSYFPCLKIFASPSLEEESLNPSSKRFVSSVFLSRMHSALATILPRRRDNFRETKHHLSTSRPKTSVTLTYVHKLLYPHRCLVHFCTRVHLSALSKFPLSTNKHSICPSHQPMIPARFRVGMHKT